MIGALPMNPDFSVLRYNSVEILVYKPWWEAGILHGMTLRELSFSREALQTAGSRLCVALDATHLALPNQCHSDRVLDLRDPSTIEGMLKAHGDLVRRAECDAIVFEQGQPLAARRIAYGVMSADCVPIALRGRKSWAVIHAGWRGLANGIVSKVAQSMDKPREGVVFAAAGPKLYEVGEEVIKAIGATAVYAPCRESPTKFLLDTAETAVKQLRQCGPSMNVMSAAICTIEDSRFHSFRRDKEQAGRSVTFVCP